MSTTSAHEGPPGRRSWPVPAAARGRRIDRVLCEFAGELSRSQAKELITRGHVFVDGVAVLKPGAALAGGELLELELVELQRGRVEVGDASTLCVLHEDADLIVIDKPPGVLAHPTESASGATISDLAALRYGGLPTLQGKDRPGIVHRLDAGTSGVMVLARNEAAFESLMDQFRARAVRKTYLALVYGEARFDSGWVETPIARETDTSRMKTAPAGEGRAAATYYEVRERFRGLALVAAEPKTGRTHQIRVHLASVGLPLVGDKLYKRKGGHSILLPPEAPIPPRQCLHASRIQFHHPTTGAEVEFEAPLAADFAAMLEWARAKWS